MRGIILGHVRLERDGTTVAVPRGHVGTLLQLLLLHPNRTVPAGVLIGELWPDVSPDDPAAARRLQVAVSRLRQLFGDPAGAEPVLAIVAESGGYRLVADEHTCDRVAFESLAREALAERSADIARRALRLWEGEPYTGLPLSADVRGEVTKLVELRRRLLDLIAPRSAEGTLSRLKLRPAWPAGPLVERDLLGRLPPVGSARILTVTAPAGFGKSTVLAQWAARQGRPVAWLSLDEDDNDPTRLWAGVLGSFREVIGPGIDARLNGSSPGSQSMLERFGEVFDADGAGIGLVLDDVHRIASNDVVRHIAGLIDAIPSTCTIALASRSALPGPLARLAGERSAHPVTSADLRFSPDEMVLLTAGDTRRAHALAEATQGWPVAAVALHRAGAPLDLHTPREVEDYIGEELLGALPKPVFDVLLSIAHLDVFNVDLCEAVSGRRDAGEALRWLRAQGLFLVDVEQASDDGWCRLQPLIAAVVRQRAAESINVTEVWRRAAEWAHARGVAEQALHYAVKAGERSIVAARAGSVLVETALRGEAHRCVRWLAAIDPDDLAVDERTHGIASYLAFEWMDRDDRGAWVRSRLRHFAGPDDLVWTLLQAIEAMREGRCAEAIERSDRVMAECSTYTAERARDLAPLLLGSAFSNQIRARVLQGSVGSGDRLFADAVALIRPHAPLLAAWVYSWWGLVALVDGNPSLAASAAEEFFQARRPLEVVRPVRRENSLLGALVAARTTTDATSLRQLAEGVEDLPAMFEAKGQHTERTVAHLVVDHLYRRAGCRDRAVSHARAADMLMRTFADAGFLDRLRNHLAAGDPTGRGRAVELLGRLTARQRAVVDCLASDLTTGEIAERLYISPQTLRTHLREVYRRLEVHSRHEAVLLVETARNGDPLL